MPIVTDTSETRLSSRRMKLGLSGGGLVRSVSPTVLLRWLQLTVSGFLLPLTLHACEVLSSFIPRSFPKGASWNGSYHPAGSF